MLCTTICYIWHFHAESNQIWLNSNTFVIIFWVNWGWENIFGESSLHGAATVSMWKVQFTYALLLSFTHTNYALIILNFTNLSNFVITNKIQQYAYCSYLSAWCDILRKFSMFCCQNCCNQCISKIVLHFLK